VKSCCADIKGAVISFVHAERCTFPYTRRARDPAVHRRDKTLPGRKSKNQKGKHSCGNSKGSNRGWGSTCATGGRHPPGDRREKIEGENASNITRGRRKIRKKLLKGNQPGPTQSEGATVSNQTGTRFTGKPVKRRRKKGKGIARRIR